MAQPRCRSGSRPRSRRRRRARQTHRPRRDPLRHSSLQRRPYKALRPKLPRRHSRSFDHHRRHNPRCKIRASRGHQHLGHSQRSIPCGPHRLRQTLRCRLSRSLRRSRWRILSPNRRRPIRPDMREGPRRPAVDRCPAHRRKIQCPFRRHSNPRSADRCRRKRLLVAIRAVPSVHASKTPAAACAFRPDNWSKTFRAKCGSPFRWWSKPVSPAPR